MNDAAVVMIPRMVAATHRMMERVMNRLAFDISPWDLSTSA